MRTRTRKRQDEYASSVIDEQEVIARLDRATGKILWQQTVVRGPLEKLNPENSHASGTPVTDGKRVYVNFRVGDEIVMAAHDFTDGRQLWLVRPGGFYSQWGFSHTPVLFEDKVMVVCQSKGENFAAAVSRARNDSFNPPLTM